MPQLSYVTICLNYVSRQKKSSGFGSLDQAAGLADSGVAQHQELDDVIEVERSHFKLF